MLPTMKFNKIANFIQKSQNTSILWMKKFSIITQHWYKITACSTYAKSDSSLVCPKGSAKTRFFHAVQCCQSNSDSKIQILSKKSKIGSLFFNNVWNLWTKPLNRVCLCVRVFTVCHMMFMLPWKSWELTCEKSRTHAFHRKNYRCYSKVFENQVHSKNHPYFASSSVYYQLSCDEALRSAISARK